jgi:type IV secretion system protein TrbL
MQIIPAAGAPPLLPPPANPIITDPGSIVAIYQSLMGQWVSAVTPYAFDLFYALAALDIAVFGWNLWMHYGGDIRQAILMTANKILILGAFLALLMNGQSWMFSIIDMFITVGKVASGTQTLLPSAIVLQGFEIFGKLLGIGTLKGFLADFPTAIGLYIAAFCILLAFLVIAFQLVITEVQVSLAIGMGYFFLGFGGSRWTTNYVERYFAYSVAAGVKLMVLYMLIGAANPLVKSWIATANSGGIFQTSASVEQAWVIMAGALIYAGVVWFCSSLTSQIFGGSPNLSHGDAVSFIAPAVSAGVTSALIAAGVFTGGASTAIGAAGKAAAGAAGKTMAGGVATGGGSAGGNPGGVAPKQPSPGGNGSGGAAGALAQVGANTVGRMPHGGSSGSPPSFNGFNH